MVVFSPSSEEALYCEGVATPVARMFERGIPVALGPDWTISGEDNMLAEMRYVERFAAHNGIAELLDPERIWRMATYDGAYVVGLHDFVGSIEEGKLADIVIFGRSHMEDPYYAVIDSTEADVDLVLLGGRAYLGHGEVEDLLDATAGLEYRDLCETIDVCGETHFVCAADPSAAGPGAEQTLEDIQTLVCNLLEGGIEPDYPELFGRCHPGVGDGRDDRLPLIDPASCAVP
jgi:hypothetical protein